MCVFSSSCNALHVVESISRSESGFALMLLLLNAILWSRDVILVGRGKSFAHSDEWVAGF